jgi:hypothetical protein
MSKYDINLNTSHFDSILDDLDNLKIRVDELINSHKLLNDKLNAKQLIIKELEAKLSPKKENIFVVCENFQTFRHQGFSKAHTDNKEYHYVHGVETLKGISNPTILFIDNWIKRGDIHDIILQAMIQQAKIAQK